MSEPQLPQDVSRWPDDPFELLGVRPGIAPRDLRKVYTGLIRTYKPEQFPEHFRRIRAAYEFVLRHIDLFRNFHVVSDHEDDAATRDVVVSEEPADLPEPRFVERTEADNESRPLHTPLKPAPGLDLYRDLSDAWELACTGEEAEAYERLRRLQEAQPNETDVYLRLYWLLALMPEVDSLRSPMDWLLAGIRVAGFSGPLRELLRRELVEAPGLALSEPCTHLLRGNSSPNALLDLLQLRWQAAQQRSQWNVITEDVATVRDRFLGDDEEAWGRLLLLGIDYLAWAHSGANRAHVAGWVKELEQAVHLHERLSAEMDRLDFLLTLVEAWRACAQLPNHASFFPLIRDSWTRPSAELHGAVQAYLALVAHDPPKFLDYFDAIAASASAVLTQFGKLLIEDVVWSDREMPPDECSSAATPRVLELLDDLESDQYRWIRPQLLRLCLSEAVSPEAVASLVAGRPAYWISGEMHLAQGLVADWPLRYVFLSCWLFWQ